MYVSLFIKINIQKTNDMKKLVIISFSLMVLFMSNISCYAQELKSTQIGIKAGINISNLYTGDATRTDMIHGFNVGVFTRVPVTNFIAFEPEFYLTTKGASITYNNLLMDGTANFNLTYLELPVLCVINVTHLVNVQFGPYISYLIDYKIKNMANVNLFNFEQKINVNNYNHIDAGCLVGVGLDVGGITMGARYSLGLTKVGKTQTFLGTSYTVPNSNNGVINFYIAVALN